MGNKRAVSTHTGPSCVSAGIQAAFDQDWASGRITRHSYRNGSEDGALAYKLLIQTGNAQEPLDFNQVRSGLTCHRAPVVSRPRGPGLKPSLPSQLTTRKLVDKEGLIPPELFYMGLTVWVSSDPLGLAASQANFYPPPPEWLHDKYDTTGENLRSEYWGARLEPVLSRTALTLHPPPCPLVPSPSLCLCPLHSPSSPALGVCPVPLPVARTPEDCRLRRSHRGSPGGMHGGRPGRSTCLPQRLPLPLLGAVSGAAALLPPGNLHLAGVHLPCLCSAAPRSVDSRPHSEWSGRVEWERPQQHPPCPVQTLGEPCPPQVLVLAMMTVELFGIMGFLGIKLSAIPVVILVASVGIGVEFTVHVALVSLGPGRKDQLISI